jgi:hypothetical protein
MAQPLFSAALRGAIGLVRLSGMTATIVIFGSYKGLRWTGCSQT